MSSRRLHLLVKSKALYTLDQSADANEDIFGISEGLLEAGLAIHLESISTHRNQDNGGENLIKTENPVCLVYLFSLQTVVVMSELPV